MEQNQQLPFRPLEYWKPPKAVRHIRAKSSALFSPAKKDTHSFVRLEEGRSRFEGDIDKETGGSSADRKNMSFATINETGRRNQDINMSNGFGPPPAYKVDRDDTLNHPWYDVKHWGKKAWGIVAGILIVLIIIIIVAAVEATKNSSSSYPDYTVLSYTLAETYSGTNFFNNFDYFTGYDPSSGFVHYVPSETAASYNLTYASSTSAVLRVDTSVTNTTVPDASTGRFSVRVTSKKQYGLNNLFIFDVKHSPLGCGTWPALWLSDPANWPTNGEIDVMEAVNVVGSTYNQMTLHTTKDCSMNVKRKETGKSLQSSCVNTTNENAGCGVNAGEKVTFGEQFNSNGGGVLAMELREAGIRMWQFARASIPSNVWSGTPDPSTWGEATADFPSTNCDIGSHFRNQSIIANIDLCGSWAGTQSVYSESCPGTCTDYVANYPSAFTNAYWEFGNFTVYSATNATSTRK